MDKETWICGVSNGLTLPCSICGKTNIQFDYGVTDEFWETLVPQEFKRSVVCLQCLDKLAHEKNLDLGSNIKFLQFTGTNVTIEFLPCNVFYYDETEANEKKN